MENQDYTERNNELFAELAKYPENSQEYRDIFAKIVKTNEPLVTYIAKSYFPFMGPTLSRNDLLSEGYLALVKAVRTFDLAKEIAFSTYAVRCIKNKISTFFKRESQAGKAYSLEATVNFKDDLVSPVNMEADFVDQDETNRQMAWVKKNLDRLKPLPKQVLISRYLSGETMLKTQEALAKEFGCTKHDINNAISRAIKKLRKIYDETHPEEIAINEEKIKLKEALKNLIATELTPMKKKTMLCKFYSPTPKTNEQVAEEIGSTPHNVATYISQSSKKLCTLCDSIKDTKHLKNILESRIEIL